jgi:hypothetical protein
MLNEISSAHGSKDVSVDLGVAPGGLIDRHNVSKEHTASIIRA